MSFLIRCILAGCVSVLVIDPASSFAQEHFWVGSEGQWDDPTNWDIGIPTASTANAYFESGGSANLIKQNVDIGYLQLGVFGDPATAANLSLTDSSLLSLNNGLAIYGGNVDVQYGSQIQTQLLNIDGTLVNRGVVNGVGLELYSGEIQVADGGRFSVGSDIPTIIGSQLDAVLSIDGPSSAARFNHVLQIGSLENALYGSTYRGIVSLQNGATLETRNFTGNNWIDIQRNGELHIGNGGATVLTDYINNNNLIQFNNHDPAYFGVNIRGNGMIVSQGTGTAELDHLSNFHGTIQANSGSFILSDRFEDAGTFRTQGTGEIIYRNATIHGGNLRGTNHTTELGSSNNFEGTSTFGSTAIDQWGNDSFRYFNNGGEFNNYRPTILDAFTNTSSGVINVNSTNLEAIDFVTHGILNINGQMHSQNDLFAGGGSRTYVLGTLSVDDSAAFELNGGLFVNNGVMSGTLNVNYGSLAKGAGFFGTVNVNDGGRFSPGNSPGLLIADSLILNEGSLLEFELRDAEGTAGIDYDQIHLTDTLILNGGNTDLSRITLFVSSLNGENTAGFASNFDPAQSYAFEFLVADGGIIGFNPDQFHIDTSHFLNSPNDRRFSVSATGNSLFLNFSAVPEPHAWIVLFVMSLVFVSRVRPDRLATPRF